LKKMFGGLSFLIAGNMCCGVTGEDLLIRLGAETADGELADGAARLSDTGRGPSPGWMLIGPRSAGQGAGPAGGRGRRSRAARSVR
jgi:hypothetical protein